MNRSRLPEFLRALAALAGLASDVADAVAMPHRNALITIACEFLAVEHAPAAPARAPSAASAVEYRSLIDDRLGAAASPLHTPLICRIVERDPVSAAGSGNAEASRHAPGKVAST